MARWLSAPSPEAASWSNLLAAVPTGPATGWVRLAGQLLHTSDGGRTWRVVALPALRGGAADSPGSLDSFPAAFILDGRDAWIAGQSAPGPTLRVTRVQQGGEMVTTADIAAVPRTGWQSLALDFITPLRGWLLMTPGRSNQRTPQRHAVLYGTDTGGQHWSVVDRSVPFAQDPSGTTAAEEPGQLVFTSATGGLAIGVFGGVGAHCFATDDGGRTWTRCHLPVPRSYGLGDNPGAVRFFGPAGIVFGRLGTGMNGIPFVDASADGGRTWSPSRLLARLDSNNTGPPVLIDPVSPTRWWITDDRSVLRTVDAGRTWLAAGSPPLPPLAQIVALAAVSVRVAWMIVTPATSLRELLWVTADGGRTWTALRPPVAGGLA